MAKNGDRCPICGEGHLTVQVDKHPVEYKGVSESLDSYYSVCDACGSEQADAAQTRDNKRLMVAFKKRVDGLLAGAELRERRERLNLTQKQAAQVFGGGPVAFSKYEADDVAQSAAMDKLLRVASEVPGAGAWLIRKAGLGPAVAPVEWKDASNWSPQREREPGERPVELRNVVDFPLQPQDASSGYQSSGWKTPAPEAFSHG
ncbi:MAG: type II toxin-antitoxin system MqsA family antitoxin [Thiohalocapsa sp.]|nr:type II toxin-antitoxin system MqsA family antitoxin [Thiohalocapsa sp.]